MIGRRSVIGIAVLCALALSAIGAASASAKYQTAFTCKKTNTAGFSDAHCKTASPSGPYSHVEIPPIKEEEFAAKATAITGTNGETGPETKTAEDSTLHGTLAGVETEVTCTGLSGTGKLANTASDAGSGFMSAMGTGTIVYSGCSVVKPAGQGCVVTGGTVTTATLFATTFEQAENKVKFKPNSGTTFATVPISGCSTSALNNNFPVTGSIVATASGATLTTTRADSTEQNTLKFGGNKAGIAGALTIKMEAGDPITLT